DAHCPGQLLHALELALHLAVHQRPPAAHQVQRVGMRCPRTRPSPSWVAPRSSPSATHLHDRHRLHAARRPEPHPVTGLPVQQRSPERTLRRDTACCRLRVLGLNHLQGQLAVVVADAYERPDSDAARALTHGYSHLTQMKAPCARTALPPNGDVCGRFSYIRNVRIDPLWGLGAW